MLLIHCIRRHKNFAPKIVSETDGLIRKAQKHKMFMFTVSGLYSDVEIKIGDNKENIICDIGSVRSHVLSTK